MKHETIKQKSFVLLLSCLFSCVTYILEIIRFLNGLSWSLCHVKLFCREGEDEGLGWWRRFEVFSSVDRFIFLFLLLLLILFCSNLQLAPREGFRLTFMLLGNLFSWTERSGWHKGDGDDTRPKFMITFSHLHKKLFLQQHCVFEQTKWKEVFWMMLTPPKYWNPSCFIYSLV